MSRLLRRDTFIEKVEKRELPGLEKPRGLKALKYYFNRERIEIKKRFIFFILYLYSLTTFNVDSKAAFKFIGEAEEFLGPISKYFRKIDILVNKWGFKQNRAALLAARITPSILLRNFFVRLSYNISIGANFSDFVKIEYNKFTTDFDYYFQKTIDKLRIVADVYTALLDSAIIISMTIVLASILFGSVDTYQIMYLIIAIILSSLFGALTLIKINLPVDIHHSHTLPRRPRRIKILDRIARYVLITVGVASFIPVLLTYFIMDNNLYITDTINYSLLYLVIYLALGLPPFIIGYMGLKIVRRINELDDIYPILIITLGEAASLAGSIKEGLRRILLNDYGKLTTYVRKLYYRLNMGIERMTAWRLFCQETCSNLIYYLTMIFMYSVTRGAGVRETSLYIYENALRYGKRRQGRAQISNYFKGMALPLHATFISVLSLIVVLIGMFSRFVAVVSRFITAIELPDIGALLSFIFLLIAIISIGNSWAIYLLKGDSIYTFLYYLGISLIMSGAIFFVMSAGSAALLSSFIRFQRGLGGVFIP